MEQKAILHFNNLFTDVTLQRLLIVKPCDVIVAFTLYSSLIWKFNVVGQGYLEVRTHPDFSTRLDCKLVIDWELPNSRLLWLDSEFLYEAALEEISRNCIEPNVDRASTPSDRRHNDVTCDGSCWWILDAVNGESKGSSYVDWDIWKLGHSVSAVSLWSLTSVDFVLKAIVFNAKDALWSFFYIEPWWPDYRQAEVGVDFVGASHSKSPAWSDTIDVVVGVGWL